MSLTCNIEARMKDTVKIINHLNTNVLPENTLLVSFDIINMFPNIDNMKRIQAVKILIDSRKVEEPSTECIIKWMEICLYINNSKFDQDHLLQTNGTETGAPNPYSCCDFAIYRLDKLIKNNLNELFFMECMETIVL